MKTYQITLTLNVSDEQPILESAHAMILATAERPYAGLDDEASAYIGGDVRRALCFLLEPGELAGAEMISCTCDEVSSDWPDALKAFMFVLNRKDP